MAVTVTTCEGDLSFEAPTIEVARLVAAAHGFHCDVEPIGSKPGVNITATNGNATFTTTGATPSEAAGKLIARLHADY